MQDKRVALITGARTGIGLKIARELAATDFTVLLGSPELARAEEAARLIDGDARALQLDVTDLASIAATAVRIRREHGRLDVLVHNPDVSPPHELFATNVFGVVAVTKVMLPLLCEAPAGRIVHAVSSA